MSEPTEKKDGTHSHQSQRLPEQMIGVITTARDDCSASDKDDKCQDDRDDTANHGQNEEAITDALPRGPSKRAELHRERDVSRCPMNVDTEADDGDEGSWIRRRDCLRDECFRGSRHVCTRMKGMEIEGTKNNQALPPIQPWTYVARVFVVADGDSIRVDNNGRGCHD